MCLCDNSTSFENRCEKCKKLVSTEQEYWEKIHRIVAVIYKVLLEININSV